MDERVKFKWILKKLRTPARSNECSGFVTGGGFLNQLKVCKLLMGDSDAWSQKTLLTPLTPPPTPPPPMYEINRGYNGDVHVGIEFYLWKGSECCC